MLIWGEGEGGVLCKASEPTQDLCHSPTSPKVINQQTKCSRAHSLCQEEKRCGGPDCWGCPQRETLRITEQLQMWGWSRS